MRRSSDMSLELYFTLPTIQKTDGSVTKNSTLEEQCDVLTEKSMCFHTLNTRMGPTHTHREKRMYTKTYTSPTFTLWAWLTNREFGSFAQGSSFGCACALRVLLLVFASLKVTMGLRVRDWGCRYSCTCGRGCGWQFRCCD